MARGRPPPFSEQPDSRHAEARKLAEKMARVLRDKPTPDAAAAVAILMAGVTVSHAIEAEDATELLAAIHGLAERFVNAWLNDGAPSWLN
jgi:hypothetical protein